MSPKARSIAQVHADWLSLLDISGPFLSIPVLAEAEGFQQGLPPFDDAALRGDLAGYYEQWRANAGRSRPDPALDLAWFRTVIEDVLGWSGEVMAEGQAIPPGLDAWLPEHKETLRPDLVLRDPDGSEPRRVRLLVQRYPASQALDKPLAGARWNESPANRMVELLRRAGVRLGLVTNGEHWMLVNAPVGEPSGFASWYAGLWFEERATLASFRALLGADRFFGVAEDATLEALLVASAQDQAEVTTQLGHQVRQAIELLVAGIDQADQDSGGRLLADVTEAEVYEAAITVMMRLVFLLFAEDQRPPLFGGDEIYDQHYSVSALIEQLEEIEQRDGEQILEHKRDAWPRLLATFRLVYAGCDHDYMRLPAYGGSLFDPDRFPFLEGRLPGTEWESAAATPLPLTNRTVLHMLQAIQFLELPAGKSGTMRQRLSFRALDVEQIGHVYEQLLEHTAKRADGPVLGLEGTAKKEPEIPLADLEAWRAKGEAHLLKMLKEQTGRSESALKKALARELDPLVEQKLRTACESPEVFRRVLPFAGLVRLDRAQRPLVIRSGGLYVTQGDDRRTTGAHYTPRSLTESIVQHTLEPLIYDGPAEGKPREEWTLKPPKALLDLKICDPAMGSGAFLVQTCRYLAERLVEAWDRIEYPDNTSQNGRLSVTPDLVPTLQAGAATAAHTNTRHPERSEGSPREAHRAAGADGADGLPVGDTTPAVRLFIAPDGSISRGGPEERLLPTDPAERLALARRLVADHCLYGVDVNPLAVDMAKLSLWLVTLQKDRPFTFLDHRLRCGDSLLGVGNIEQLRRFSLEPGRKGERDIHSTKVNRYLQFAIEGRRRIEQMPADDALQVEEKARRFRDIEQTMDGIRLGADLLVGAALADKRLREDRRKEAFRHFTLIANLLPDAAGRKFRTEHVQASLAEYAAIARRWLDGNRPFHWPLEFPEIFIDSSTHEAPKGFSAIVGNPPFMNGTVISTNLGASYRDYLRDCLAGAGSGGRADLAAYFVRRYADLSSMRGMVGMIATKTISEGDSREIGLDPLVSGDYSIPRAVRSRRWPGKAALNVAHLWIWHGGWAGSCVLDDVPVDAISSHLTIQGRSQDAPKRLLGNMHLCFKGSQPYGSGFLMDPSRALSLIDLNPDNRRVLLPFVSGDDLNSRWDQSASRWVIQFDERSEAEARAFPEVWEIAEKLIKPERMQKDASKYPRLVNEWWKHWNNRPELRRRAQGLERVFASTIHTKHLAFSPVPARQVFSHGIVVVASEDFKLLAVLSAAFFSEWAVRNGSSLGTTIRFTPSDCFETFPFPLAQSDMGRVCELLIEQRRGVMAQREIGLTDFFNAFHDDEDSSEELNLCRELQVILDLEVADAYGWNDLDLEHGFHETKQGVRFTISERARREVLDRLLELNHQRYAEEVEQGLHDKGAKRKGARAKQTSLL